MRFAQSWPNAESVRPKIIQNSSPHVFGGQRLQQLEVPREFMEAACTHKLENSRGVGPSNLAEARARLMAKMKTGKTELG